MVTIAEGIRWDAQDLFDSEGNPRMIKSLTRAQASQIAGYEIILKNAEAGDGHIDRVLKLKLVDRARYVEMMAKHFQLLIENIKLAGNMTIVDESLSDDH